MITKDGGDSTYLTKVSLRVGDHWGGGYKEGHDVLPSQVSSISVKKSDPAQRPRPITANPAMSPQDQELCYGKVLKKKDDQSQSD